jgi:hypothetical protein
MSKAKDTRRRVDLNEARTTLLALREGMFSESAWLREHATLNVFSEESCSRFHREMDDFFRTRSRFRWLSRPRGYAIVVFASLREVNFDRSNSSRRLVQITLEYRLAHLAKLLVSRKQYELVYEPLLSDFEIEYFEALKNGDLAHARLIRFRYVMAFMKTVFLSIPLGLVRTFVALFRSV